MDRRRRFGLGRTSHISLNGATQRSINNGKRVEWNFSKIIHTLSPFPRNKEKETRTMEV
jgi:hypothetical protein